MATRQIDGQILKKILCGGASEIRLHEGEINDLNVFPVPDGDTGTNMSRTIESGIAKISDDDGSALGTVASSFAKGSLLGARGNSGVILSQFFAGLCGALADKISVTPIEIADAYIEGVKRSYMAVAKPVEGTILTVFRESAEYARAHMDESSTLEDFLSLTIEEAERSLVRTKDILPVLTEADVVDSGGAGYLCIARGMYESLTGKEAASLGVRSQSSSEVNYDLFTTDSTLEFGYCTECLVRLQRAKGEPEAFDDKAFVSALEQMGCDSIVAIRDGDILKVHAHTHMPSDILTLCQRYGEFLSVKVENMSLQHSERMQAKRTGPKKTYGIVTVATGEGLTALFEQLDADVVINGGQTGNPSAEQFLEAFETLNADNILVLPNNSNILLTAAQAAELWQGGNVTVIPTKTLPEGYAALSVFNSANKNVSEQVSDMQAAIDSVVSCEVTAAIRDCVTHGVEIKRGEYIGIVDGTIVTSNPDAAETLCDMLGKIEDMDEREIITLFVGSGVDDDDRVRVTELIEERFFEQEIQVYIGGQEIYDYIVAVE